MVGSISDRTLTVFCKMLTGVKLGDIEQSFRDEGFQPQSGFRTQDTSKRRATARSFLAGLDWSNAETPMRLARVIETLVNPDSFYDDSYRSEFWDRFVKYMEEDGWMVSEDYKVTPPTSKIAQINIDTSCFTDPSGVREQLKRLHDMKEDVPAIIGASKELVESVAEAIVMELGLEVTSPRKFPDLVKAVNKGLGLSPDGETRNIDSEESVKRILGGATNIVLGLNELRNLYGTGHGSATARTGLYKRHADLAVNAAGLWCQLVVDTLNDPYAPWHKMINTSNIARDANR